MEGWTDTTKKLYDALVDAKRLLETLDKELDHSYTPLYTQSAEETSGEMKEAIEQYEFQQRLSESVYKKNESKSAVIPEGAFKEKISKGFVCCICSKGIDDDYGNNPWPITYAGDAGRCCNDCNRFVVMPARVGMLASRGNDLIPVSGKGKDKPQYIGDIRELTDDCSN